MLSMDFLNCSIGHMIGVVLSSMWSLFSTRLNAETAAQAAAISDPGIPASKMKKAT